MGYPMDTPETINALAKRIHAINVSKGFYEGLVCGDCYGSGSLDKDGLPWSPSQKDAFSPARSPCRTCKRCAGRGSINDKLDVEAQFHKHLDLFHSEITEALNLNRLHPLSQLIQYDGVAGVTDSEMARKTGRVCVPAVPDDKLPHHPALAVELADIVIRVLDDAYWLGLDIGQAIHDKVAYNETRPVKHGKRF